jgi:hypothetical protein
MYVYGHVQEWSPSVYPTWASTVAETGSSALLKPLHLNEGGVWELCVMCACVFTELVLVLRVYVCVCVCVCGHVCVTYMCRLEPINIGLERRRQLRKQRELNIIKHTSWREGGVMCVCVYYVSVRVVVVNTEVCVCDVCVCVCVTCAKGGYFRCIDLGVDDS